jgi:hypothetical protein
MTDLVTGGVKYQKDEQLHHIDPLSLLALGRVYEFGGRKYDAYNYLKGYDYSLSYDAMQRHMLTFWSGEDCDPESGEFHVLHAVFHGLTLASFLLRDIGNDDRPPVVTFDPAFPLGFHNRLATGGRS